MAAKQPKKQEKPSDREWRLRKGLDAFGNMFALNLCFVIASIPVITIGASLSATYAMAIRLQEGEEETVLHGFIHEFKRSFKQATLAWLLVLVATAVLLAENILVNNTTSHGIAVFYTIVFYLELLLVALVLAFLFPMIGRYTTTVKLAIKNSLLLSVGYVFSAIKIIVAWVAPIALSIIYPLIFIYTWYMWLLLIFGAIIWGTTHTIRFVFRTNEEAMESTREQAEQEAAEAAGKDEGAENGEKDAREKDLPPKKELIGVAARANVLKGTSAANNNTIKRNASGNSSGYSSKSSQNGGWYRGDKYDKSKKKKKKK